MIPFKAPQDDILFLLQNIAGPKVHEWDADLSKEILSHFAQFSEDVIAPLNSIGDLQGARLENGRVRMPDGFADAYAQLADGGWQGLTAPELYNGMGQSPLLALGVSEIFSGANHSLQMVCNLVPGAVETLLRFGTEDQKSKWIPKLASGEVLSTMCLTEAGAGSDLSRIRCRARSSAEGWKIDGEKIFISGGDQNLSDGILHLVLARSGEADEGVKGLSLFLCSSQSSGISISRLEEKLGLHASPTCQMVFDNVDAELIGLEGQGLKAMFTVMNHARIDVALQGVAHANRAWQISHTYAQERTQGRRPDGSPAKLVDHADVSRMLNVQRRLSLGARAMCYITMVKMLEKQSVELVEFLTPLCKVFCSEAGIKAADLGIQILGGYGYLTEYGISQTWRDARITSIYEGANGVHERAISTRGLKVGSGADEFECLILELAADDKSVEDELKIWRKARKFMDTAEAPAMHAHEFAQATAKLFYNAVWVRLADAATGTPQEDEYHLLFAGLLPGSIHHGLE